MSRRPLAALLPLLVLTGGCGFIGSGDDPLVIAFRGGNGYWPENSRLALANAVLQPWDGIHVDLAVTADEVAVLYRGAYLSPELCTGVDPNDPTGEQSAASRTTPSRSCRTTTAAAGSPTRTTPTRSCSRTG